MPLSNSQLKEHIIARFWAKIRQAGDDECWLWQAGTNADGYGRFRWQTWLDIDQSIVSRVKNGKVYSRLAA